MNSTMLEQEVSNLPAGKDLDKKMYSAVFGYNMENLYPESLPNYSTDICAAMRLLEYLKNKPFPETQDYLNISFVNGKWLFEFRGLKAYTSTLALGITRVAFMYGVTYKYL